MKTIFKLLLGVAALSPFCASAFGYNSCGFDCDPCYDPCCEPVCNPYYLTIRGGGNDGFNHDPKTELGWYVGGALGYRLNTCYRFDLSYDFLHNDFDHHSHDDIHKHVVLLNGWYDLQCFECINPFFGAGIGYARVETDADFHENQFAFQVGAGLRYDIDECWSASLEYRLLGTVYDGTGYHNLFGLALTRNF